MKLDFKKFTKVKEDKHSTTLRHPDGHEVRIAHAPLNPKMRSQLAEIKMSDGGLVPDHGPKIDPEKAKEFVGGFTKRPVKEAPKDYAPDSMGRTSNSKKYDENSYADGGQVQGKQLDTPEAIVQDAMAAQPQAPEQQLDPMGVPISEVPGASILSRLATNANRSPLGEPQAEQPPVPQMQEAPQQASPPQVAPVSSQQQAPSDPFGANATSQAFGQGLNREKYGIQQEALAAGRQGRAEAAALEQAAADQAQGQKTYHEHYQQLEQERNAIKSDIENFHIDPDHYLNSRGVGTKIMQGIGLILGGMGAGAHGVNPGDTFIQNAIQRDVEAQGRELGKKQNLLSENLRQFGNLRDATEMTRVQTNDIVANRLKVAAARAMDPLAKARALEQVGKLDRENSSMIGQIAMRKTMLSGMQQGKVSPSAVVNFALPEGKQAAGAKELGEMQEAVKARNNALQAFDFVTKNNTWGNRLLNPLQSKSQIKAAIDPITAQLSKATAGRFTEQDAGMLESLWPKINDKPAAVNFKRQQINKLISEKMNYPILEPYGITPESIGGSASMGAKIPESAPIIPGKR